MALLDFAVPRCSVPLPGSAGEAKEFTVRGASFDDAAHLVNLFRPELESIFNSLPDLNDVTLEQGADVVASLIQSVPHLTSYTIALLSDEASTTEELNHLVNNVVKRLPIKTQEQAIRGIGRLTFEEQSPKEFVERIVGMMKAGQGVMDHLMTPGDQSQASTNGSTA